MTKCNSHSGSLSLDERSASSPSILRTSANSVSASRARGLVFRAENMDIVSGFDDDRNIGLGASEANLVRVRHKFPMLDRAANGLVEGGIVTFGIQN